MQSIEDVRKDLLARVVISDSPSDILKTPEFKQLYSVIKTLPIGERSVYGKKVNKLRLTLESAIVAREAELEDATIEPIDVTAPWDVNTAKLDLLPTEYGTQHPLTQELENVIDIFTRMGFEAIESRQIDNDYNMFSTLNFPENHPARDSFDTFRTEEGFLSPAHTSTMQNRILKKYSPRLGSGDSVSQQIAVISYGRVFRNEDIDATHEHTFYQYEGIFVSQTANLGQMLGTLRSFFETYYGQKLKIRTQPSYFPFVEPGLEFAIEKPATLGGDSPDGGGWLEMLGCGMIHPNVLAAAGIDPIKYRGFAWGGGIERLAMLKYGVEDIRHFESGKLQFLREFV